MINKLTIGEIQSLFDCMEKEAYRKDMKINQYEMRTKELEDRIKDLTRINEVYRQNLLAVADKSYEEIIKLKSLYA